MMQDNTIPFRADSDGESGGRAEPLDDVRRRESETTADIARQASASPGLSLDTPSLYLNRETTWLEFNRRVLHEAQDQRTPLLERVKFAAIAGSNLDEFFMKRIGGLRQQVGAGVRERTVDGRTPEEQIAECFAIVRDFQEQKQELLTGLWAQLAEEGIAIVRYDTLSESEQTALRQHFVESIYPLVTPQSIDPAHPFPFISNLSLNLLVTVRYPGETTQALTRVKVPVSSGTPRFVRIGGNDRFVLLEEVMCHNLDLLFPGMEVVSCEIFRVTRNANTEKNEEHAEDLLFLIESELQERKFAPIVRLEIMPGMDPGHRGYLAAELGLKEERDVFAVRGFLGTRDLFEIVALNYQDLKRSDHHPIDHPALQSKRSIFHIIRDTGSILVQFPYESFSTSLERFLMEAAEDPKVRAVKMTLYRTSARSRVIDYLVRASQNGKQVAVVVELKARFDEEANIRLASRMEEAGIHVTYGVVGLKTHSKIILVVRQDYSGVMRYVHIGTGNYHSETSRTYSDLGIFTSDRKIGSDATELFNYLTTGFTPKRTYTKLLVAPKGLKKALLSKIRREKEKHSSRDPGLIRFKMNALEDVDICRALYEASMAGVRIELIIRDSCRVRPGIPGLSENIRVISIIGRFLEHSRIYYFRNGGSEEYYIGSADAMRRNLEHRVEVVTPVEEAELQAELDRMLKTQWHDRRSAWEMAPDGTCSQRRPGDDDDARSSQDILISLAEKRHRESQRLKKRRPKNLRGRNTR